MWQIFYSFLLQQLFPQVCCLCHEPKEYLCIACKQTIQFSPKWVDLRGMQTWTAYDYHINNHARLIQFWKYKGEQRLLQDFIRQLELPLFSEVDLLIPIPLHRKQYCKRGFNQAEDFAKMLSSQLQREQSHKLVRLQQTKQQATLSREERFVNLIDQFRWQGGSLENKHILLVDDVISTGSTLYSAAEELKNYGAKKIQGICLFRGGK